MKSQVRHKRILVTGSAGFLGYHLTRRLYNSGADCFGIDDLSGGDAHNVMDGMWFYEDSCLDYKRMKLIFESIKPHYVIHAACYPHEGLSIVSPKIVTESVTVATNTILSLSVQHNVKRFVFMSSMSRYGKQDTVPFTESMTPKPVDPYGWAKYAAEGQVESVCSAAGIPYVILVPHNIYGTHQKYDDPFRNVAAIMCNRILQNKPPIIYGDGFQKRCFSYVSDLIDPIISSLFEDSVAGKVINIGPDDRFITINELATLLMEIALGPNHGMKPIYHPDRPREVKHANCSADLARKLLGVEFKTSIEHGMLALFDWVKLRGSKPFKYHLPIEIMAQHTPRTWSERLM